MEEIPAISPLVRSCMAGDAAAWEEIVRLYNRRIYNICYRFTGSGDDADDLTQEVFIKMYRSLGSYDVERGSFTTWISTLARNLLVDHYRRTRLERASDSIDAALGGEDEEGPTLSDRLEDTAPTPDARFQSREVQAQVHTALQKLSPDLREAVILRDLQDMDYKEIAQVLKVPEGTVKSRINRGRTELARLLSRTHRQVQK